jgi:hypothetical protein
MKKITELVTKTEKPEQKAKKKAITFGSFKRAEDRQVAERKQKEHEAELAGIAEDARIQRAVEDEHQRVIKEQNTEKRNKFVTESLSNAFKPKVKDMESVREQAVDTYLPREFLPVAKDYPEPFKDEPALNKELADFKVKINEHLTKVGFASSGGGGIGSIADAADLADGVGDGEFLQYRASDQKFISSAFAIDDGGLTLVKIDIDGGTDIGAGLADADLFIVDDAGGGTNRKTAASRIKTYVADVTLTTAAQTNITSVGTLTALQVDNLNINGNTLSSTAGTDLLITPLNGQQIVLDGTIVVDAGVVTGATSITSTAFVGGLTGDVTGNADTASTLADARTIGGVSFNGSANINLPGVNAAGNQNTSGTAATVTTAAQTNITSLGTLTALTVDNIVINGANIGHTSDTDAIAIASDGDVTLSQNLVVTGDFTVNGTTTTVSTTNMKVSDTLIELNTGATSNANDMGIIMERGSTGNNAIFMFDESADEFTVGTTTATNDATGNISITTGTFTAATLKGNLVVADDGNIGSASDTDSIAIASNGVVTFSQVPVFPNNTVESADIQADAITGAKIADDAINSEHYTNGSIDTAHIAADQIVASLIADNAINSEHYTDGSIDKEHLSTGARQEVIAIACGDESTAHATGTAVVTFAMPYAFTLTGVKASVTVAPVGSTMLVDINEAGTTILSTKLMIDASEKISATAATAAVISDTALADNALITIDIDQIGSSTAGAGLKVYLIGYAT